MATQTTPAAVARHYDAIEAYAADAAHTGRIVRLTDLANECGCSRAVAETCMVEVRHRARGLVVRRRQGPHPGVQWVVEVSDA